MREILFRGKKYETTVFDETDWVYGSLIDSGNHGQVYIYPWINGASTMSVRKLVYARMEAVKPETVGQFTGLVDRKGQRIFEGDIIRIISSFFSPKNAVVIYQENTFILHAKTKYGDEFSLFEKETSFDDMKARITVKYQYEKIGNIHDNPELMGGK